ncbi:MAG: hypothetical protein WCL04_02470 [Verrucomicrobiota bacterium]
MVIEEPKELSQLKAPVARLEAKVIVKHEAELPSAYGHPAQQ